MTDEKILYVSYDTKDGFNITSSNKSSTQIIINKAIKHAYDNKYTIVHIRSGTYVINNPIEMYSGITLEGDGKDKTCIKLIDHAALDTKSSFYIAPAMRNPPHGTDTIMTPLIWGAGSSSNKYSGVTNAVFRDFEIDVNFDNNSEVSFGRGYFNCIQLYNSKNVKIYNMYMHDGHGDGVRYVNGSNLEVYNCLFEKLGHDTVFCIRSDNCHHYNNKCIVRTNSGGRMNDCTNSSIHDNEIYAWSKTDWSAGNPGIQIERQYKAAITVDVYNNYIHDTYGCGIWCARNSAAVTESGSSKINIYNNIICGCGNNKIYYLGGIVISEIHNVYFYNNIVDGCYGHGVVCMGMTDATVSKIKVNTYVRNNIIINTKKRAYNPSGTGFGIHNRYTATHVMTCSNNCVYNNASGAYKNVTSKNDIAKDPLFADENYTLKSNSPCVSAGVNSVNIGLLTSSVNNPVDDSTDDTSNDSSDNSSDETVSDPVDDTETQTKTKIIYPKYNNRMKESSLTSVFKTDTFLDVGSLNNKKYRGIIYFDLSDVKDKTVKKATLSMYWYYPTNTKRGNDTIVEIYRAFPHTSGYTSWQYRKQGITWNTVGGNWYDKSDTINGTTPFSSQTFTSTTVPSNKYYNFDITDFVKNCIDGSITNTGLFIKAKTENDNYIAFYNGNVTSTTKKIKLTIEYE